MLKITICVSSVEKDILRMSMAVDGASSQDRQSYVCENWFPHNMMHTKLFLRLQTISEIEVISWMAAVRVIFCFKKDYKIIIFRFFSFSVFYLKKSFHQILILKIRNPSLKFFQDIITKYKTGEKFKVKYPLKRIKSWYMKVLCFVLVCVLKIWNMKSRRIIYVISIGIKVTR